MDALGIGGLRERFLLSVSAGEQRLVFLARALVKNPALLILDEPCQGLDSENRAQLINLLDRLCLDTPVNLIYITHHFDEMPEVITHVLKLERGRVKEISPRKRAPGRR